MEFRCLGCSTKLERLFSLGSQPLANKYPRSQASFKDEFSAELEVFGCGTCNYSHVPCSVDRSVFFEDYYYLSSVNTELVNHFEDLAAYLKSIGSTFVVDVGSNDGVLLKPLKGFGIKCLGVDPSENVGKIANDNGLDTIIDFFDLESAKRILTTKAKASTIVASSVFTHLENPTEFFKACDLLLDRGGDIIIEVEYLLDIFTSLGFERFYFDRPHYFTLRSIQLIAEKQGFQVVDCERIKPHGGSLRLRISRISDAKVCAPKVQSILEEELEALTKASIQQFFKSFEEKCQELRVFLTDLKKHKTQVMAYGCPARLSTITNFSNIGVELLPYIVDDSPIKSGRYSPGKHIPIYSEPQSTEVTVIMTFAYEYINSIRTKIHSKFPSGLNGIEFYRPIPLTKI